MVVSSEFDQKGFQVTLVDFTHLQCYIQTSVKYKSASGFRHESGNQWKKITTGQFIKTNSVFVKTIQAECVWCILHNLYPTHVIMKLSSGLGWDK